MPTESFLIAPTVLTVPLHSYRMLAYHPSIAEFGLRISDLKTLGLPIRIPHSQFRIRRIRNFGTSFEPRYIVGAGLLDQ
jgi:hypothetical protein